MSQTAGGQWLRASDQKRFYDDYLRLYGMTWDDVKYPALLKGESYAGALRGTQHDVMSTFKGVGMVSRNIMSLYR